MLGITVVVVVVVVVVLLHGSILFTAFPQTNTHTTKHLDVPFRTVSWGSRVPWEVPGSPRVSSQKVREG